MDRQYEVIQKVRNELDVSCLERKHLRRVVRESAFVGREERDLDVTWAAAAASEPVALLSVGSSGELMLRK